MKTMLAALIVCSASFAIPAPAQTPPLGQVTESVTPRNIQVLLEKDATEALLEVKGPYYIFNPHDGSRIGSGILGKRFLIHEIATGLKWGEEFPGIHQIYIQPRSAETSIFINGIQYGGSVAIYGVNGTINVVNDIDIELYVKSILTTQFPTPLEPEVMSSLAILSRTNAYYQALMNQNSFWHTTATENHYLGNALIIPNSAIERSVDTTRNLILVSSIEESPMPFATAWTEHSGGKTARYETIFRKSIDTPSYSVEAPHAALTRQDTKWSYTISKKAFAKMFDLSQVKSLELFVDKPSHKVYGLRVQDANDSYDLDFFTLQNEIGMQHILSSDFTVTIKDETITFTGFGKGHGVGLCLYSASAMAQNGENAVKILSKFFPNTYLYNLNLFADSKVKL